MSLAAKQRARPQPTMNVTPLVDVVLVLLIIFMVVIPMMETTPSVSLPDVLHPDEDPKGKTDPYTLSITADGAVYFEKEPVPGEELAQTLRKANQADAGRRLVLRADRATPYAKVRALFRACQAIGFPGVSMRVNAVNTDEPS
ncbi:MAG: biopolymer transporter ExbD [Polyangiales bacterium]